MNNKFNFGDILHNKYEDYPHQLCKVLSFDQRRKKYKVIVFEEGYSDDDNVLYWTYIKEEDLEENKSKISEYSESTLSNLNDVKNIEYIPTYTRYFVAYKYFKQGKITEGEYEDFKTFDADKDEIVSSDYIDGKLD